MAIPTHAMGDNIMNENAMRGTEKPKHRKVATVDKTPKKEKKNK
jgi:hypothetical protein